MPVSRGRDSQGCYARWGGSGKKYYYTCNDDKSGLQAVRKANEQAKAAYSSGYKEK